MKHNQKCVVKVCFIWFYRINKRTNTYFVPSKTLVYIQVVLDERDVRAHDVHMHPLLQRCQQALAERLAGLLPLLVARQLLQ